MKKLFIIAAASTALFGATSLQAGEKKEMKDGEKKEMKEEMEDKVALGGYCPVCYIAAGKANKGKAEFASTYEGKTYHFVSEDVKALFDAEPTKWLPQYDGYCAFGLSLGKKFESDPTVFTVVDKKVYLNKNAEIGKKFRADKEALITKADTNWKELNK